MAAASATLLCSDAVEAIPPISVDSALLVYTELDRVSVFEAVAHVNAELKEDQNLKLILVFDTLTGASANGATPSKTVQTFTRPSGKGSYSTRPGDTPLDDTFRDTRFSLSATYDRPLGRLSRWSFGAVASTEYDYLTVGGNTGLTRDFNQRNTTVSAGLSFSYDRWMPQSGIPIPFASMSAPGEPLPRLGDNDSRNVIDGIIGLTQVLGRSTLGRLNYSVTRSDGYLTDPYKLLSVVAAPGSPGAGDPRDYLFENRPRSRTKQSLFGQVRRHLGRDVLDLSYRFLWDSWDVVSHTVELRYQWNMSTQYSLMPHLRFYRQGAAGFYQRFLIEGSPLPGHVTADYRLGAMDTFTVGAKFGGIAIGKQRLSVSLEYYVQLGARGPPDAFGSLVGQDLYPTVDAFMLRLGYAGAW